MYKICNKKVMYDKVKLWVNRCDIGGQYPNIASYLDEAREQTDLRTGEIRTYGSLQGLKVSLYVGGLSIVGSFPKYLYGSNIYPLDRESTREALSKIEDTLHLSLNEAKVTGFEFGCCFAMRHQVKDYLDRLGSMPRLQRYRFNQTTLYYKHRGKEQPKTFCYYDKIADAMSKKMEIPKGLRDANLLRCEIRLDGRLPHQLGVPEVTASTLSDRQFYKMVMQRFQKEYFSISKMNRLKDNAMNEIKTVTDGFDCFVGRLMSLTGQGQEQVNDFVEELKSAGVFKDRNSYVRLKERIEKAASKTNLTITDELIKELDDEFKNVGAYV